MRAVSALFILALAGCSPEAILVKQPQPIEAHCAPECFVACISNVIHPRWSARVDGTGTADDLYAAFNADRIVFQIAAKELEACDSRRGICARCLTSLYEAGAIVGLKND